MVFPLLLVVLIVLAVDAAVVVTVIVYGIWYLIHRSDPDREDRNER